MMFVAVNFASVNLSSICTGVNIGGVSSVEGHTDGAAPAPARQTPYHHGDLRNALVSASAELAELGGPAAVTVRAAARATGVTATAAYRHFSGHEELLAAVCDLAGQVLFEAMNSAMREVADRSDPVTTAIARLATAGRAYIAFAEREPGLFRTAFSPTEATPHKDVVDDPIFALIGENLDILSDSGFMDPRQRTGAEFTVWAAVHGLATLMVDGPLSDLDADERESAVRRMVAAVFRGCATGPNAGRYLTDPHMALEV